MPFIKRGVYQRLRFCSETTVQHYILADITAVCSFSGEMFY